ncbi:MAG: ABC transporter ATP-binding protein [Pseudomonadota bacterium]
MVTSTPIQSQTLAETWAHPLDQTPVLECRNLCISYFVRAGEVPAVVDFNLRLMPGEAHGLVGESGCGKSTVALAIMNYMGKNGAITGGEILFQGRDMRTMTAEKLRQIRGSKIAMVYQEPMASLNPSMKIADQLAEVPLYHEDISQADAFERSREMLSKVRLPDPGRIMDSYPHQISGGQQQRVVIAMALLSNPALLLLDEPTTALDVTVEAGIVELIKDISNEIGTSMIYISHNLGLILETCDHLTVMYSGEAVEVGRISDVFSRMRHPYTQGLFSSIPVPGTDKNARPLVAIPGQLPLPHQRPTGCNFGPRCSHAVSGRCDTSEIPMVTVNGDAGHKVRCVRASEIDWTARTVNVTQREPVEVGDVVLRVEELSKHYEVQRTGLLLVGETKTVKANDDLTFRAREAETVAIVGESGCGKSTFAKVLMGLEDATAGEVFLGDLELGQLGVRERDSKTVAQLQMIFQNPFDTLNPSHTVGSQIARVIRKFGVETDPVKIHQRVLELLDTVKLPREFAERRPRQLSGGQKQRVGIARAFAGDPKVVIADEPVSALDVSVQAAVTELLMDIQRDNRTTLLFISHDLSVVRYLADRVIVMYLGQIMEKGTTEEIFSPPYHPYTEALLSAVPIADMSVTKRKIVLSGELPSPTNPPAGCPFSTRCPYVMPGTCESTPPPERVMSAGHAIACHLQDEHLRAMQPVIEIDDTPDPPPEPELLPAAE